MNLPVKQKHFLSFSRKLFLSVISLFLVFAFCFIAYQYQREREYKVELLNTQLQNYNSRLYERLNSNPAIEETTEKYIRDHALEDLRVTLISKPFSLREVIARVKAVLRRTATMETEKAPERLTYQSLVIDITKKKVSIDDEEVQLTKKEFEILLLLVQNKGRVFSREDILARIWSDEVYVLDRTIDVNITRLRKKIGEYGKCIVTRLGYGYCFEAE